MKYITDCLGIEPHFFSLCEGFIFEYLTNTVNSMNNIGRGDSLHYFNFFLFNTKVLIM